jgi:quinol monooxygenase YgiN
MRNGQPGRSAELYVRSGASEQRAGGGWQNPHGGRNTRRRARGERCIAYKRRMSEVIVQGVFSVDPNERDRFVEASVEAMRSSRQEQGCLEYVMAADPLDPERVVLSERWESMDHLQQHLARQKDAPRGSDARPAPRDVEITVFEVATSRALR